MTNEEHTVRPLDAKRRDQTTQALARLVVGSVFVALWFVLWLARIPMPVPFLLVLLAEALFFLVYWRTVFLLPSARAVERAQYTMLAAEIIFHTTMVYFLGGISWLGPIVYVFGLIFNNGFLDMRRGLVYTGGASLAFTALILLEATGTVPHYVYLEQGALRYTDARFVATTAIGGVGVFFSIYLWVNWVGYQLRRERDGAVRAQEEVSDARSELERTNAELEERVIARTVELEQANAALKESETQFRTLAETMTAAVVIVRSKHILYVNPATEAVTGYSREELLRMDFEDVIHPDSQQLVKGRGASRERGEDVAPRFELMILAKNGETRWLDIGSSSIEFEGSEALLATAFDVTERKRAEEALREQARRDPLTGLLNRRAGLTAIEGQLERAKRASGRFAVLALDIDRFKAVNDTFGHEAGDQALVQLAGLLADLAGAQSVVCRMGGDEFEIGLEGVGLYRAVLRAEELRAALQRSLESSAKDGGPRFTISIGVACYPQEGENVADLRRSADRAMYAAKAAGGDTTRAWRHLAPRQAA